MLGAALSHTVAVDGQEVVALRAGDQYTIPVAAGWRTIGIICGGMAAGSLRERLEAGKQYYFRTSPTGGGCPAIRKVTGTDLPPIELTLNYATPADVESKLFGDSGLVRGSRRFHAEFERMVLTSNDAGRLRTLIKEALPSPAGSELKLQGTINGTKFVAKMKKDKAGWVYVKFEGLTFQSKPEMEEFLAPFSTEDVEEAKLEGSIAGRRLEIKHERGVTHPR